MKQNEIKSDSSFSICPNCDKLVLHGFLNNSKDCCILCKGEKDE